MRNSDRNKKANQAQASSSIGITNTTIDNKGNYFNSSKKPASISNDVIKQSNQLLDIEKKKKNNNNPCRIIDSTTKKNTTPISIPMVKEDLQQYNKKTHKQKESSNKKDNDNGNNNSNSNKKQKESVEKYSTRTVYKTSSSSSKNIKKILNDSIDVSDKQQHKTAKKKNKKLNSKLRELADTNTDTDYKTKGDQRSYAKSFIGKKKNNNRQVNTSPGIHSIKSNDNNTANDKKQLNNSKSNKTVKYYSLNTRSIRKRTIPKTTINMNQEKCDNKLLLLNKSLEKENENNITSILYLLTKINNFLSDSFLKFIDFFPLNSKDNGTVLAKRNEDITGNDLLHLVNTNRKILNWNLAKSELFLDMNMIYNNISELKDKIVNYHSICKGNDDNRHMDKDAESEQRVTQYNQYFDLCYSLFNNIRGMLNSQINEINQEQIKLFDIDIDNKNDNDIVINNNVDDINEQSAHYLKEDIFISKEIKDKHKDIIKMSTINTKARNVNIINSVSNSNSNINVNVNVNLVKSTNKNKNKSNGLFIKKKSKRHQTKKLKSKRQFVNEINEDAFIDDNKGDEDDMDVSLGNDQGGIQNCPKAHLFNVQKPKEENLKYKVYTSNSSFESSEKDEKSVSKIVIGEIESYKDIIEQDKISAFKNMRSKSSFNLKTKTKIERNFDHYRILDDERQISDLDDDEDELNQEEINDEFNDQMGSKSKRHLHQLPYHISKISFCKIFDEAHGNIRVIEDSHNINIPQTSANKRTSFLRTTSKTFYINDKQGLEYQKNKECIIY